MPLTRLLLIVSFITLTACKIQVTAPEGGSVVTTSGSLACTSGNTCEVSVTDLFFDETFQAQPNSGYTFNSWRKRDRGFCGGNTEPCRLFTAGFAGNSTLMAFLERDDVFYLEPVFDRIAGGGGSGGSGGTGGSGGSGESLTACLNPALYSDGARFDSRYRYTSSGSVTEYNHEQRIDGTGTFNGQSATRLVLHISGGSGENALDSTLTSYFSRHGDAEFRQYGNTLETTVPGVVNVTNTIRPYRIDRFNLNPGESFSHNMTVSSNVSQGGTSIISDTPTNYTTTYEGIVSITVPAGTFRACKTATRFTNGSTDTHWWSVDHGVIIKMIDGAEQSTQELVSGTLNGVTL